MQVYKIEPNVGYSGGSALVAATSAEEAIKTFCTTDYKEYLYDYYNCTCNIVVGLDYDSKESTIIFNDIYIE